MPALETIYSPIIEPIHAIPTLILSIEINSGKDDGTTSFIAPWCDFIFVNTIISESEKYTVSLGLYKMINAERNGFNDNFTVFCAGASGVGVIIVTLFMSMQRDYVEGVTGGAVKG